MELFTLKDKIYLISDC